MIGMPMGDPRPPRLRLKPALAAQLRDILVGMGFTLDERAVLGAVALSVDHPGSSRLDPDSRRAEQADVLVEARHIHESGRQSRRARGRGGPRRLGPPPRPQASSMRTRTATARSRAVRATASRSSFSSTPGCGPTVTSGRRTRRSPPSSVPSRWCGAAAWPPTTSSPMVPAADGGRRLIAVGGASRRSRHARGRGAAHGRPHVLARDPRAGRRCRARAASRARPDRVGPARHEPRRLLRGRRRWPYDLAPPAPGPGAHDPAPLRRRLLRRMP